MTKRTKSISLDFQVGRLTAAGLDQLGRADGKYGEWRTRRCPDDIIMAKISINEDLQLGFVTKRRHASYAETGRRFDRICICSAYLFSARFAQTCEFSLVKAVGSRKQGDYRMTSYDENEAFDYLGYFTTDSGRGFLGGSGRFSKLHDLDFKTKLPG